MPEEFFKKTCLTRSFISGAAYPAHNPLMVWCYMWKKNFLLKGDFLTPAHREAPMARSEVAV